MAYYQFTRSQQLKASLDQVWEFISHPRNLKEITPSYMGFDITTTDLPQEMYQGMIIGYHVKPLCGIKTNWVTEITHVKHKAYFVDEQRIGPYRLWHHQHHLKELPDGVMMNDIVTYQPPFGILGALSNRLIIHRKLEEIFNFRTQVLEKKFASGNLPS